MQLSGGGHNDSEDEWQEMPVERISRPSSPGLDELDSETEWSPRSKRAAREARLMRTRREHLRGRGTSALGGTSNMAGQHLNIHDVRGYDWRTRPDDLDDDDSDSGDGVGYTKVRLNDTEENQELNAATDYLFQEDLNRMGDFDDPSAAPISQLAMTKRLLSESQKFAYVGLCCTLSHQMVQQLEDLKARDGKPAVQSAREWVLRVMVRLYQHLDIEPTEQSMIESLSQHGILPSDLAPSLVATQTIPNPAYDPKRAQEEAAKPRPKPASPPHTPKKEPEPKVATSTSSKEVLTDPNSAAQVADHTGGMLGEATHVPEQSLKAPGSSQPTASMPTLDGVSTEMSETSKTITLDLRWTVLCDLFLVLTADSVYDARSRVLLERLAETIGLTWMDVTRFEKRITDTLEIEEDVQTLDDKSVTKNRDAASRNKRLAMMGLATVGGGLVIGLSAGLLAPVIGAGIGAALGAVGISGTSAFLGGVGGATIITTTGTISGATMGGRGMSRRIKSVQTFEFRPLHYHKRVNCIITVPGFLKGPEDDPTLPYSVIDPIMGDVFSIMWEPEMMQEMGNAMSILWNETLVQGVQQVLAATVAGAMFSALAWPLWLTKLNYLIDNPWSNATERARTAGLIFADVLMNRQMGVRPITLVGFSLGARMIFYALLELARKKAFGIVQDVYLMGAPVTSREHEWKTARTVVSGRFVNAYSRSDWILAYLHRATSGGVRNIAGLHPFNFGCNIENIDVTNIVPGHLAYRALTPLVLGELGFQTTADYFDEPESLERVQERTVETDAQQTQRPSAAQSLKNLFWGNKTRSNQAPSTNENIIYDASNELDSALDGKVSKDMSHDQPPREEQAKEVTPATVVPHQPVHGSDEILTQETNPTVVQELEPEAGPRPEPEPKTLPADMPAEPEAEATERETLTEPQDALHAQDDAPVSSEADERVSETSNIPSEPPAYASYGLGADEAAALAAQFQSGLTTTAAPARMDDEWETEPTHDKVPDLRPNSSVSQKSAPSLPEWASGNPWG